MKTPISIGDEVVCRFRNFYKKEHEWFGKEWAGTVVEIDLAHFTGKWSTPYKVTEPVTGFAWITDAEILRGAGE